MYKKLCIIWLFGILFEAEGVRIEKNACAEFCATKLVNRWAEHDTEQKLWAEQNGNYSNYDKEWHGNNEQQCQGNFFLHIRQ